MCALRKVDTAGLDSLLLTERRSANVRTQTAQRDRELTTHSKYLPKR